MNHLLRFKVPRVVAFLDVYYHVDNAFEFLKKDLTKMYIEAKDNVRFLSTLERHFKNVTHGANFQVRTVFPVVLFAVLSSASCRRSSSTLFPR